MEHIHIQDAIVNVMRDNKNESLFLLVTKERTDITKSLLEERCEPK